MNRHFGKSIFIFFLGILLCLMYRSIFIEDQRYDFESQRYENVHKLHKLDYTSVNTVQKRDKGGLVDIILFNDELDMLNYRLWLHNSFVEEFIIVEARLTFSGDPKPLYAYENFKNHTLKSKITFVEVDLSSQTDNWAREHSVRKNVMRMLSNRSSDDVYLISDVDELIDENSFNRLDVVNLDCIRPKLKFYYYCLSCRRGTWNMQTMFRRNGSWFQKMLHEENTDIRKDQGCKNSEEYMGWHVSYFMSTEKLINKLNAFSHSKDGFVKKLLLDPEREKLIERRITNCTDLYGRNGENSFKVSDDNNWPSLKGLPQNEHCLN